MNGRDLISRVITTLFIVGVAFWLALSVVNPWTRGVIGTVQSDGNVYTVQDAMDFAACMGGVIAIVAALLIYALWEE